MPFIGTFEYTKAATLTVGGGKDQGPTAQVTHLRNQRFLFCSVHAFDALPRPLHLYLHQFAQLSHGPRMK